MSAPCVWAPGHPGTYPTSTPVSGSRSTTNLKVLIVRSSALDTHHRCVTDLDQLFREHVDAAGLRLTPRYLVSRSIISTNRRNRYRASCGPGDASGWYCTENVGCTFTARPSQVRSFRLMCVVSAFPRSDSTSTANPWFCAVISTFPVVSSFT